jgi:hypothetical protein
MYRVHTCLCQFIAVPYYSMVHTGSYSVHTSMNSVHTTSHDSRCGRTECSDLQYPIYTVRAGFRATKGNYNTNVMILQSTQLLFIGMRQTGPRQPRATGTVTALPPGLDLHRHRPRKAVRLRRARRPGSVHAVGPAESEAV